MRQQILVLLFLFTSACSVYRNSDRKYYENHARDVSVTSLESFQCETVPELQAADYEMHEVLHESPQVLAGLRNEDQYLKLHILSRSKLQTEFRDEESFRVCSRVVANREEALELLSEWQ